MRYLAEHCTCIQLPVYKACTIMKIQIFKCVVKCDDFLTEFYSQLNTSGREPSPCDTPISHSIDIPTEELKIVRSSERLFPPTLLAQTLKHIDKATNIIYTHVNIHTDNEISEKE